MSEEELDERLCYEAIRSRDTRFDGRFFTAVLTTGIYCRPSCPSRTPKSDHVRFFPTAAGARQAGFRACLRCHPDRFEAPEKDAIPGSPTGRDEALQAFSALEAPAPPVAGTIHAMARAQATPIPTGVADWAAQLGWSVRQLRRLLTTQVGAPPRTLLEAAHLRAAMALLKGSDLPVTDVAFAAGFASLRVLEETMQRGLGLSPTQWRHTRPEERAQEIQEAPEPANEWWLGPALCLRIPFQAPMEIRELLQFLAVRAVPGLEEADPDGRGYRRVLSLTRGLGIADVRAPDDPDQRFIDVRLKLETLSDLGDGLAGLRRLLDTSADPRSIQSVLSKDPLLAEEVTLHPGRRVPGHVDGAELAVRAVLGQQVSVAAARTHTARLVERYGTVLPVPVGSLRFAFPRPKRLAQAGPEWLGPALPHRRRQTIQNLAEAMSLGKVPPLRPGADPVAVTEALLALPGIGPWTASYITMRALSYPDAFPAQDLGVLHALRSLTQQPALRPRDAERVSARWRPFRSYAVIHLWSQLPTPAPTRRESDRSGNGASARPAQRGRGRSPSRELDPAIPSIESPGGASR